MDRLPAATTRPGYDPSAHGIGVVHLGIGAFHRAHQADYFDQVLARFGGDWRILGVSLRSPSVRDQLEPQAGLFTLVVQQDGRVEDRVIGSVAGVLVAPENPGGVIAAIAAPTTTIVSLTVTEKGYCHDPATGRLNRSHPDIVRDLAEPDAPRTAIGYLAAGCAARMAAGGSGLTVLSCDNLPHNGAVLRAALLEFCAARAPGLAAWVEARCRFPATMIDRIVPATTESDRIALAGRLGMADEGMVKAEPFAQWVIEDDFAGARPALEDVGVQVVADVRPFELAKLRMLNGAHSTLAYLGLARGFEFVHQAMGDPAIAAVVDRLMAEAAATLPTVGGLDPAAYAEALKSRFRNASIEHRLAQIAMDGSQKIPQRLLATIAEAHSAGRVASAAAQGVAAWIGHFDGLHVDDPLADRLQEIGRLQGRERIEQALTLREVFGDLAAQRWFVDLLDAAQVTA
ncbi:mannitol dehydrogenase family protein [Leptolyngbya sp. 15MV]|nr:mannitol dehydrogenase family protein [Leptolyngbya sp. 15MV]